MTEIGDLNLLTPWLVHCVKLQIEENQRSSSSLAYMYLKFDVRSAMQNKFSRTGEQIDRRLGAKGSYLPL